jgi:DNA-binding transcriptional ArsR family regulator
MSLLQLLADETNVVILRLLKVEPTYPRRLAGLLGKREQKVVPRLKKMEDAGLIRGAWSRRGGRNVKVYELTVDRVELVLGVEGVTSVFHPQGKRRVISPPLYLPPQIKKDPQFIGRKKELKILASRSNFIILEGISGIGKTSLLQAFVYTLPTGSALFWHSFKETDSFDYVVLKLATFLRELDFVDLFDYIKGDGKDDSAKLDLLTRGLDQRGYVVIFDDYQRQHDEKIDVLFRHLQTNISKAKTIVASRVSPNFLVNTPSLTEVKLEGLSRAEVVTMLRNRNVKLKEEQMSLAYQKTAGHPLALTFLGTVLGKDSTASETILKKLPTGKLTDEFLRSLNGEERNLLIAMSSFRNPIPFEGISHVVKSRGIRYLLQSLQKKMILKRDKDSYLLHEVVREGCYEFVDYPEQMHRKIGEWYLARSGAQEVLEGLHHLSKAGDWVRIGQILTEEFLEARFRFVEQGFSNSLVSILEAAKTDEIGPKLSCSLLGVQARAFAEVQEWGKARVTFAKAKAIAKKLDDPRVMGCLYTNIGKNCLVKGDLVKAEKNFLVSARLLRRANDVSSLKRLSLELSKLYFAEGDVVRALKYLSSEESAQAITS